MLVLPFALNITERANFKKLFLDWTDQIQFFTALCRVGGEKMQVFFLHENIDCLVMKPFMLAELYNRKTFQTFYLNMELAENGASQT
jgi:hypothetical protein